MDDGVTILLTAVLLAAAAVLIAVVYRRMARRSVFTCPFCGHSFRASMAALIFTVHVLDEFQLTCPSCGRRGMMPGRESDEREDRHG